MPSRLVRHRQSAYIRQSRRCFYCQYPMWENNLESFAQAHNISTAQAKRLKCTAEHLKARKDGGKDAATKYCRRVSYVCQCATNIVVNKMLFQVPRRQRRIRST
jgi:hypothetical protein